MEKITKILLVVIGVAVAATFAGIVIHNYYAPIKEKRYLDFPVQTMDGQTINVKAWYTFEKERSAEERIMKINNYDLAAALERDYKQAIDFAIEHSFRMEAATVPSIVAFESKEVIKRLLINGAEMAIRAKERDEAWKNYSPIIAWDHRAKITSMEIIDLEFSPDFLIMIENEKKANELVLAGMRKADSLMATANKSLTDEFNKNWLNAHYPATAKTKTTKNN